MKKKYKPFYLKYKRGKKIVLKGTKKLIWWDKDYNGLNRGAGWYYHRGKGFWSKAKDPYKTKLKKLL